MIKKCIKCGADKELNQFYRGKKAGKDGHDGACKECRKKNSTQWQKTSPKRKVYEEWYMPKYRKSIKQLIFDHYGWICACCNETGKSFLTLDHVNNDGYLERKIYGRGNHAMYLKVIRENFPNKYQILCMNCNFSKRINSGICEHKLINING